MTAPPQQVVDFSKPENDRRTHNPGRRAADFQTCFKHDETCERVRELEKRIVGKWAFNTIMGIVFACLTFLCGLNVWMFSSIKSDIDQITKDVKQVQIELAKHAGGSR